MLWVITIVLLFHFISSMFINGRDYETLLAFVGFMISCVVLYLILTVYSLGIEIPKFLLGI